MPSASDETVILYRMVIDKHVCPWGLRALHLLKQRGYKVDDRHLTTREETEAFMKRHGVATTPQIFIGERRIGGHDDLRRYLGLRVRDPKVKTYRPVFALFAMAALMALAASQAAFATPFTIHAGEWFVSFAMCLLAMLKLRDVSGFATMFLGYDLLARRWVPYATLYPFAEATAGVLMTAHLLTWFSAPLALFIGGIGAVSVFKAVYIDRRDLKCACVGGDSNVPLGFISLTENLLMIAMAVWMLSRAALGA